jgi:acetyltransferase-like isoleucine patch superfamily enzyme
VTAPGAVAWARTRLRSGWPLARRIRVWVDEHPAPDPSEFAAFGDGSWVVPPTEVIGPERISIGVGVIVLEHGSLVTAPGARLELGRGTRLARDVHVLCTTEVVLEADVSTSDYVAILDSWGAGPHERARALPTPARGPVRIGQGAYLGCGAVIGPGVTVGAGAYVGEGAVVLDDVPAHALVRGNPAVVAG